MLAVIGVGSIDELLTVIPAKARAPRLGVPDGLSELELFTALSALAAEDRPAGAGPFFLGAGVYRRYIPAAVPVLATRGEFLTAYTPYQPEVSQGTLQAIWEYQSLVAELLGMDVSNASLYDGSTAVAEAAMLAVRATGRRRVVVAQDVHPHHRAILHTYAQGPELEIIEVADTAGLIAAADGAAGLGDREPLVLRDARRPARGRRRRPTAPARLRSRRSTRCPAPCSRRPAPAASTSRWGTASRSGSR